MFPRNLFLIGYRGTGKTTTARLLAELMGWQWVDADQVLEAATGLSIKDIFAAEGEAGFREREAMNLTLLCQRTKHVIATGGGAILRPANRVLLKQSGYVVWLTADAATIHERLQRDPNTAATRPPLTKHDALEEIRTLLRERETLYRAAADLEIDTSHRRPEDVAGEILKHLEAT